MHTNFLTINLKGRHYLIVDGRIILKSLFKKQDIRLWIRFSAVACSTVQEVTSVSAVLNVYCSVVEKPHGTALENANRALDWRLVSVRRPPRSCSTDGGRWRCAVTGISTGRRAPVRWCRKFCYCNRGTNGMRTIPRISSANSRG
jgi:hypothetical protein